MERGGRKELAREKVKEANKVNNREAAVEPSSLFSPFFNLTVFKEGGARGATENDKNRIKDYDKASKKI